MELDCLPSTTHRVKELPTEYAIVEIIDKANESSVVLLTLSPDKSHRMQPLDRTVFGPFMGQYNKAADQWMLNKSGKSISIYDIAKQDLKTNTF